MWGSRQWRRVAARYADEPRAQPTMRPPRPMHRIAKATRRPPDQAPEPAQLFNSQVHSKFRPTEADPSNRCIQHSKRVAPGSGGEWLRVQTVGSDQRSRFLIAAGTSVPHLVSGQTEPSGRSIMRRRNCRRFHPFFCNRSQLVAETAPRCNQTLHQSVRPSDRLGIDRCE